jgi:membrane-bound ClpP family serine protease
MFFLLMMIGGGMLIVSFLVGELFEFAHDLGDSLGDALGGVLDSIGLHLPQSLDGDGGASPFSSRVVFAFVTAFGGMGTILTYYGVSDVVTILLSLVAGFAGGAVVWLFAYVFFRKSVTTQYKDADLIGAPGRVTMAIPGAGQLGEVSITVNESSTTWFAVSADGEPIAAETPVTVIARSDARLTVRKSA